jgi:Homing endonuclease associated repeat/HNH endonuclease
MKFELEESLRGASDEEFLKDMRRCAKSLDKNTITMAEYVEHGKAHPSTIQRRFGSWPNALKRAGLEPSRSKIGITNDELFENLRTLWINMGRQPRYSEIKVPQSKFSAGTYENRFGSWSNALREFIGWANADIQEEEQSRDSTKVIEASGEKRILNRRSRREISTRQRFRILVRDGFRCKSCGATPLTTAGIELHVDHIVPWSKGGETIDDNLETKCERCNLGKGNAFNV